MEETLRSVAHAEELWTLEQTGPGVWAGKMGAVSQGHCARVSGQLGRLQGQPQSSVLLAGGGGAQVRWRRGWDSRKLHRPTDCKRTAGSGKQGGGLRSPVALPLAKAAVVQPGGR